MINTGRKSKNTQCSAREKVYSVDNISLLVIQYKKHRGDFMGLCNCDKDYSYEAKDAIDKDNVTTDADYVKKPIMSKKEIDFYRKLKTLCPEGYILQCQIPLSSIVEKHSESKFANELFRTVDFGFLNATTFEVQLLIELNDNTHNQAKRIYRDAKVKDICAKAGIKLITFWTNYPNQTDYIKSKIQQFIK